MLCGMAVRAIRTGASDRLVPEILIEGVLQEMLVFGLAGRITALTVDET
jgi:hypothetical protein